MTVTASIKFDQGGTHGAVGQALFGIIGVLNVASNGNNANVERWIWTMLDVPPGSGVPLGVISDGPVQTASFTPDVDGGYFVQLDVFDHAGNKATDKRVFGVQDVFGFFNPPFDAEAGALNFGGQLRGWATFTDQWLGGSVVKSPAAFWRPGPKGRLVTLADFRDTPNATPVTVFTKELANFFPGTPPEFTYPAVIRVDWLIQGVSDDAADVALFSLSAGFLNTAGVMTQAGTTANPSPFATAGAAGWSASIAPSGGDIVMALTGDAGPRLVHWFSVAQFMIRGV